jgi:hypothetical protein
MREYGYKKFGWKPKPTVEVACADCGKNFLPNKSSARCCSVKCGSRLRYKENPERYRAKAKRNRLKTHAAWKARGRATWAEMMAQRGEPNSRFAKARQPWLPLLTGAQHRSAKSGMPFALTREWCEARWTGRCELTGIEFILNTKSRDNFAPSIDKIDPRKGYVPDNCRFILFAFNLLKFTGTDETMYALARALIGANTAGSINSILSLPC